MFGLGRPRALDRNAKVRIMHWARCLSRRIEKGRAYGVVTAKALAVLEALLWAFHNAKSGLCFPSYEKIAEAAHCARSTVAGALRALESCGILSWVHRLKRVREPCPDLLGDNGWRWRVLRTSNAYNFRDPGAPNSSKANFQSGTPNQGFFSSLEAAYGGERTPSSTAKGGIRGRRGKFRSLTARLAGISSRLACGGRRGPTGSARTEPERKPTMNRILAAALALAVASPAYATDLDTFAGFCGSNQPLGSEEFTYFRLDRPDIGALYDKAMQDSYDVAHKHDGGYAGMTSDDYAKWTTEMESQNAVWRVAMNKVNAADQEWRCQLEGTCSHLPDAQREVKSGYNVEAAEANVRNYQIACDVLAERRAASN